MKTKVKHALLVTLTALVPVSGYSLESNSHQIDQLNNLLKGEISAVETYQMALKKIDTIDRADTLIDNLDHHQEAVKMLRNEIVTRGGTPASDSGAWGIWAKTVQETSNLFGDKLALKALREGEQKGLNDYKETLKDGIFPERTAKLISDQLLDNQVEHIRELDEKILRVS